jgi:hypothetical protein
MEIILLVSVAVFFFIGWVVTLADIMHQSGLTSADRLLWMMLVTFVPFVGMLVYWFMSGKISADDPTNASTHRSGRAPRRSADLPPVDDQTTKLPRHRP